MRSEGLKDPPVVAAGKAQVGFTAYQTNIGALARDEFGAAVGGAIIHDPNRRAQTLPANDVPSATDCVSRCVPIQDDDRELHVRAMRYLSGGESLQVWGRVVGPQSTSPV